MKKLLWKIALLIAVIAVTTLIELAASGKTTRAKVIAAPTNTPGGSAPTLIIDAGHGGVDGGAVSGSGVHESELNLDIAQKLDLLMGFFGTHTVMTRSTQSLEYSPKSDTIRAKKSEDLNNRIELINSTPNAVLISVHQNKYTSSGPFGAQVLYAKTPGSEELAKAMQEVLISTLNPKNYRSAARAQDSIYMMGKVKCPALLIECGFLSNPNEEALLLTEQYRLKIAAAIASGYLRNIEIITVPGGLDES